MTHRNLTLLAALALFAGLAIAVRPAAAQSKLDIGPSKGQVAAAAIGLAAAGAAIGIGVYYAVKHNRSVTGSARSAPHRLCNHGDTNKFPSKLMDCALDFGFGQCHSNWHLVDGCDCPVRSDSDLPRQGLSPPIVVLSSLEEKFISCEVKRGQARVYRCSNISPAFEPALAGPL
jgi:hypothetical protein